jgi:hypothetical protein
MSRTTWLAYLASGAVAAFVLTMINQYARVVLPLPASGTAAGHALGLAYLLLLLAALLLTARAAAHLPNSTGFLLLVGLLLAAPLGFVLLLGRLGSPAPLWLAGAANGLFLPAAAALAGAAIGRVIRHPNTLLAGAGFAVFFDIVVVTMGTVAVLLRNAPHVIAGASVGGGVAPVVPPAPGRPLPPPPLSWVTIGPADVLFLALFLAAVTRLGLSERATLAWMYGLLAAALVLVELQGWPVPALAPMGVAVLLANARHARFTRDEKVALVYGGAFALVLAALMVTGARTLLAR